MMANLILFVIFDDSDASSIYIEQAYTKERVIGRSDYTETLKSTSR